VLLGQPVRDVAHIDEHLVVEPGAGSVEVEDIVSAAARDVGGDGGGKIGRAHIVHFDLALVLLAELAREDVEVLVVVGNEVLPLHDLQHAFARLRGGFAGEDRRCGQSDARRQRDLQKFTTPDVGLKDRFRSIGLVTRGWLGIPGGAFLSAGLHSLVSSPS